MVGTPLCTFFARVGGGVFLAGAGLLAMAGPVAASPLTFTAGDLVVSVEGNGSDTAAPGTTGNTGAAASTYLDNQAAPLSLYQFSTTGAFAGAMELPTVASGGNSAISGEYGSSSEGTLQLTGNGQYLTIMGYGVNPTTYDSTYDVNGLGTALAQSCSLTSCNTTPSPTTAIPRVVAEIGANGSVNSSTTLYNVFNTNNPRSVYSATGQSFYVSGQGSGSDSTGGVFYTTLGSSSATAITGSDTSGDTIAQDTRDVQIYNNTLYVSVDTKEGSGSARDFIGTLGAPPATSLYNGGNGPTMLPGFGNSGGTGKVTLTAGQTNGINHAGQQINLSPENFFFANADTLYVADSGDPKNNSATTGLGDGGLQKWSLVGTTWVLDYTLAAGLDLVPNTATCADTGIPCSTGLLGLTGAVVGNEVELFATNFTLGDLDPTFLYGITDQLSATSEPTGETFDVLAAAPADSDFKGVAFAPVPEPSSLAGMAAALLALGMLRRRRQG